MFGVRDSGPYGYASGGPGGFQVGQTAKARSGYRVQSLHVGRNRQRKSILIEYLS